MGLLRLVKNVKTGLLTGLAMAAAYIGSAAQPVNAQTRAESYLLDRHGIMLPADLTQQDEKFYQNTWKEFEFYRETYRKLTENNVLSGDEIGCLEIVLSKTLAEVDEKTKDLPFDSEMSPYMRCISRVEENDLKALRKHLEDREKWKNSKAAKGDYWCVGAGIFFSPKFYPERRGNGRPGDWLGLYEIFKENSIYRTELQMFGSFYRTPYIQRPDEEFPIKTQINNVAGSIAGIAVPIFSTIMGNRRKRKRGKALSDAEVVGLPVAVGVGNLIFGTLMLDSLHPVIYPLRVLSPIIYETGQHIFGKRNYVGSTSAESHSTSALEEEAETVEVPTEFVNPWEIDLRNTGGNRNESV